MSGLGRFTTTGHVTQDFGPGITVEPDGIYIQRNAGGWWKGRGLLFTPSEKLNDIHLAIDIGCPTGTPVLAPEAGIVVAHAYDTRSGHYTVLQIRPGTLFLAMHLAKHVAAVGARVARGQKIALSGASGKVTGPHVHAAIRHHATLTDWRLWHSNFYAYNPERLMVGGDMAGAAWIRPLAS